MTCHTGGVRGIAELRRGWGLVAALCVAVAAGCDDEPGAGRERAGEDGEADRPSEDEASCRFNDDCAPDGKCIRAGAATGRCMHPCRTDADCEQEGPDMRCGVGANDVRMCAHCDYPWPCVDGVPTDCALLDETHCEDCGCPSGERCIDGDHCGPLATVGEACTGDDDCNTANCSRYAGVCRVPLGQPCTQDDCDTCFTSGDSDWSSCSRQCHSSQDCDGRGDCRGYPNARAFCYPLCSGPSDASCPRASCEPTDDDPMCGDFGCPLQAAYFCACEGCAIESEPRALGQACQFDMDCGSERCLRSPSCSTEGCGYCTSECERDADCGGGDFVCVEGPCSDAANDLCGRTCARTCEDDAQCGRVSQNLGFLRCVSLATAEGASASVCHGLLPDGSECSSDGECFSGECSGDRCVPAGSAQNGDQCAQNADCGSGICTGGLCNGGKLLGEACTSYSDCAVGDCCEIGSNAGTCQNDCS